MINFFEVNETNKMVEQENLDVRTITIGISLLECIDSNLDKLNDNIYYCKGAAGLPELYYSIKKYNKEILFDIEKNFRLF